MKKSDVRFFFFFQAEDGIRDYKVTGVQTCALPISVRPVTVAVAPGAPAVVPRTRVAVAMPVVGAVTEEAVIEPPPLTAQVTVTPLTGLLLASVTLTLYGVASVAPMVSV